MSRRRLAFFVFPILTFTQLTAGCSGTRNPGLLDEDPPAALPSVAEAPVDFEANLTTYLAQPEQARIERRSEAETLVKDWRKFEHEAYQYRDSGLRHWYYQDVYLDRDTWGVGLGNSIMALKEATALDPSFAEGWCALGRLCSSAGDLNKSREYLDHARTAVLARALTEEPVDEEIQLEIYRQRAWTLRDLALWDEGLAAVQEGLEFRRGDRDLVLIKGLLLAGAGRTQEAMSLAVRMPPYSYPQHDQFHYGQKDQTSDYANRWIKSQALLATGDYELARHVIGELNSYPYRRFLPHQERFWADVGLVAELTGDEQTGAYYALGLISSPYRGYFPWLGNNLEPLVMDFPDGRTPFFTSFGNRFHIGGSPLAYAASQMNQMTFGLHDRQRDLAAGRAIGALDIAERRHIRPDIVQAMRGRIYFAYDRLDLARRDLEAAHEAFTETGRVDSGTSLLLGMLNMNEGQYAQAVPLFRESLTENPDEPVGWRSLGVSLVHLGRKEEAAVAMDRALELEPNSVAGLYNRGLLHLQNRRFDLATADLDLAYRLDPENHEVQRLLQMAAANYRAEGGDPGELQVLTDQTDISPEQIMARLEADIESFFAVPDSLRDKLGTEDQVIISLENQYFQTQDNTARKILALAYMDRGMYEATQALLNPGWGVDLTPEEEIMLLYVDRSLGERERSRQLADLLLKGEKSDANPYLLMMLAEEDRKHWTETILAGNHFYEGYGARVQGNADARRYARAMRLGFTNLRMASQQQGVGDVFFDTPFFRFSQDNGGVESAVSGGSPTSGSKQGNVVK